MSSQSSSQSSNTATNTLVQLSATPNPTFAWGDLKLSEQDADIELAKTMASLNNINGTTSTEQQKYTRYFRIAAGISFLIVLTTITVIAIYIGNGLSFDFNNKNDLNANDWPAITPEDRAMATLLAANINTGNVTNNFYMDDDDDPIEVYDDTTIVTLSGQVISTKLQQKNSALTSTTSTTTTTTTNLTTEGVIIQPVIFHVIHKKDGTGMINVNDLPKQIDQLNRAFRAIEAKQAKYKGATDARVQFVFHAVDFTENDDWHDLCGLFSYQAAIKTALAVDPSIYYNVYICWVQNNLGLAWLPYQAFRYGGQVINPTESSWMLGVLIHYQLLPGNTFHNGNWASGDILTHETGHHYGLMHPYEGDCFGTEADSDQIDDTPRMTGNPLGFSCPSLKGRDSCPQNPGKDDIANYMIATSDACRTHFTPGQVAFMRNTIQTLKPTLFGQKFEVGCVAAVDNTDASIDLAPCIQVFPGSTASQGRKWCRTNKNNLNIWAWACCASDGPSCRSVSSFSNIVQNIPPPALPPTVQPSVPPTKKSG
jgi:hypothetical protein